METKKTVRSFQKRSRIPRQVTNDRKETKVKHPLSLTREILITLFPDLTPVEAVRLLQTNKEIAKLVRNYFEQLPVQCEKRTNWNLACLDPIHGHCLPECIYFGLDSFLSSLSSLLGQTISFSFPFLFHQGTEEWYNSQIEAVALRFQYIAPEEKTFQPFEITEMSFDYMIAQEQETNLLYHETQNTENPTFHNQLYWTWEAKEKIIPRLEQVIQRFGALCTLVLMVKDHISSTEVGEQEEGQEKVQVFAKEGKQSLGWFTIIRNMDLYEDKNLERSFRIYPRLGKVVPRLSLIQKD